MASALFAPLTLRGLTVPNRVWVSPMCQYSAVDGYATEWHMVHLGALATGGAGLVLTEADAVLPEGRISPDDLGIWSDAHAEALEPIVRFAHAQGALIGTQLAHAGRKASSRAPWKGHGSVPPDDGGWTTVAPSALAFGEYAPPVALDQAGIERVVAGFAAAARRAADVGFDTVELHAAHGYLLHQFLSPLSNTRDDAYGGSPERRARIVLDCAAAVRDALPDAMPLLVRLSATDWVEGGWDLDATVELVRALRDRGVDLVDCSSGGLDPRQQITPGPGYQVPFAARVRADTGVPTGAVGLITEPAQAEEIVASGAADVVLLARAMLREPRWALRAAAELGAEVTWPPQYLRARPR